MSFQPPRHGGPPAALDNTLLQRIAALEARLAALERAVTVAPGGGVTITAQGALKLQAGGACTISVGANLAVQVGGAETITVGGGRTENVAGSATLQVGNGFTLGVEKTFLATAGDTITLRTGQANLKLDKSGDVDLSGGNVNVKATKDMILKGSKIKQN